MFTIEEAVKFTITYNDHLKLKISIFLVAFIPSGKVLHIRASENTPMSLFDKTIFSPPTDLPSLTIDIHVELPQRRSQQVG